MPGENDDPLNMPSEDAALERFKKIRAELEAMELPDLPEDEIDKRTQAISSIPSSLPEVPSLESIRAKAWESKERYDSKKAETAKAYRQDRENAQGLGVGLSIAYIIVGFPFVGILLGWLLDWKLGTQYIKGIGALAGATMGIVVALAQINRNAKNT